MLSHAPDPIACTELPSYPMQFLAKQGLEEERLEEEVREGFHNSPSDLACGPMATCLTLHGPCFFLSLAPLPPFFHLHAAS